MVKKKTTKHSAAPQGPSLYLEDPLIVAPPSFRSMVGLVSFLLWGGIFLFGLLWIGMGLRYFFGVLHASPKEFLTTRALPMGGFWLGVFLLLYVLHHWIKVSRPRKSLQPLLRDKELQRKTLNVADFLTPQARGLLAKALDKARAEKTSFKLALFEALLDEGTAQQLLNHLEVNLREFKRDLLNKSAEFAKTYQLSQEPPKKTLAEVAQISFYEAFQEGAGAIDVFHLLLALLRQPHPVIEDLILKTGLEVEDVRNVAVWLRAKTKVVVSKKKPRKIKHQVMNRAWTAKPTYFLDSFSDDLTDLARHGQLRPLVGHREEYQQMVNILNQEARNNVLLIGEAGSGRTTIIQELARQITRDNVPESLFDKRLVSLDVGSILAGLKAPGELQERLQKIMDEILAAKNIILAIPQIQDLIRAVEDQSLSFMSFFGPVFQQIDFPVVATTDERSFHRYIERNGDLAGSFNIVKVKELSKEEAIQFLLGEALILEKMEGVAIGYFAIKAAVELSDRYLRNRLLPGKAYDLLAEAVEEAKSHKRKVVTQEDIKTVVGRRTGIPVKEAGKEESEMLLSLEKKLHERLIDQELAVKAVAEALRQARAGLEKRTGPIGTFLFVGPTGVGKTELARTLAHLYFGGTDKMQRFDMSEYQDIRSIYRLIGSENQGGFLTEAIKNNPFSLVLLDEFEKAHRDVLNLFLQVFEDGRLTDELGNVVDFSNTIIICTSNAHSVFIKEEIEKGTPVEKLTEGIKQKLTDYFKPELLNRFDEIVVFRPLKIEEIEQIARLKLRRLFLRLEDEKRMKFTIAPEAVRKIAQLGYDPVFGARPLNHLIRKRIKSLIAQEYLKKKLEQGGKYKIVLQGEDFAIQKAEG